MENEKLLRYEAGKKFHPTSEFFLIILRRKFRSFVIHNLSSSVILQMPNKYVDVFKLFVFIFISTQLINIDVSWLIKSLIHLIYSFGIKRWDTSYLSAHSRTGHWLIKLHSFCVSNFWLVFHAEFSWIRPLLTLHTRQSRHEIKIK